MPELPEVETVVRTLAPQVTGKVIHNMHILHAKSLQSPTVQVASALHHATIERVFRRAKLVMLQCRALHPLHPETNAQFFMAFHLKMTGRFFVHPGNTAPLKHTRLIFDMVQADQMDKAHQANNLHRLFFDDMRTFGYCRVMLPHELDIWDFWQKLGPEPLETVAKSLAQRLHAKRGSIKAVLLDQTVVAGIGNIYADEALFQAGIVPTAAASSLSMPRLTRLAQAVQNVLQRSIEECGSSIRDYRDANGDAGSFQNNFFVYGRKGALCRVCNTPLDCSKVAGRTTVWCRNCQKG
ncbi:bifunctional DNA-formamidopyrimidine glycosylase/DNA-(apurinic or apyrimidinic site) lyase [Desulfovibrio cuneatus]|uniref:bifunctional DNA-formamidopyrimidine glycosylase/DNA-(apurinic or apyrimidinic site) lyase n=1 Tax=Desulfovibrio cuneatus TaxID=159728 RepID=UPI0003FC5464|nr:bifunctional DNA-formamidopyrimidine glycosylase/DNA-(apurinic or apyrimidinic site) lyase [Desulfovibrio cuneatus]